MKKLLLLTSILLIAAIASAQVINVPADYGTIQEGINAASNEDTVLVANGTYFENINFKGKAITVASQFLMDGDTNHINNTIIDGSQPLNSDSASTVYFVSGEDTTSIINGVTVTNGNGTWSNVFQTHAGGGILCHNSGAKIIYCNIIDNEIIHEDYAMGGGISCMISNGNFNLVIENNSISENTVLTTNNMAAGGGIFIGVTTPAAGINAQIGFNNYSNNYCGSEFSRADGGAIKIQLANMATASYNIYSNLIQNNSIKGGSSSRGGGLCGIGTGALIFNNTFKGNFIDTNSGQFRGAAIAFKTSISGIQIIGNQFIENNSPININDCTGAISILDAWEHIVYINKNIFIKNKARWGAGLYVRRGYNLSITNNVFWENTAYGGGCISLYNPENDKNKNSTGAEYKRAGIINNSFVNNTATYEGGAIRFSEAHTLPIIFNSIFWNNTSPSGTDIVNLDDEKITISFSRIDEDLISGLWSGTDNITDNPFLISGDSLCHLSWQSPCIGAGTDVLEFSDTTYYCPDHDYDGEFRPMCALVDIGADESPFWVGINETDPFKQNLNLSTHPNPSSGILHLRYSISDIRNSKLEMYSADGVLVRTLVSSMQQRGKHELECDMNDLPNGLYLIRLQAGKQVETAKVILVK